ncbi:DEAD/DEAH box helicase [Elioraea sp. Yellowstone]|uniref:DEAD/DEAH box helicase n=1 Tax=Elioraea sp. Yellowstone TaxID=2592070 RepID=UPI00114EC2B0|nr:DEAD/DEAH box helicase [Elioraea sp. Yellowstone]TQF82480.1 DEAD/DEAH box helicase [Elioraea sp. Yellowstone]
MTTFNDLGLAAPILEALAEEGYDAPTPIQAQAIPPLLQGRDLIGIAQTGTGKTAAFALPILDRLRDRRPPPRRACRALVLSPTRELASQIAGSFRTYGRHLGLRVATVFGGVGHQPQVAALARGVDILVATPGRLIDHLTGRTAFLEAVEMFVLDEADQMLDMGFIQPIRRIVSALPEKRQTLLFSATMPQAIATLADEMLKDPVRVAVAPVASTAEKVEQRVVHVAQGDKRMLLAKLLKGEAGGRTLVFVRTKHGADRVVRQLEADGIAANAIHGNRSQGQREAALRQFRDGAVPVLVATDIAARGIDVEGVTHVINMDLPNVPEQYVHRIGRTARAGAGGVAISFCSVEERPLLRDIERLIRRTLPAEGPPAPPAASPKPHRSAPRSATPAARGGTHGPQRPARYGSPAGDGRHALAGLPFMAAARRA